MGQNPIPGNKNYTSLNITYMPKKDKLIILRNKIDRLDRQVVELLDQRVVLTKDVGDIKEKLALPFTDAQRENQLLKKLQKGAKKQVSSPGTADNIPTGIKNQQTGSSGAKQIQPQPQYRHPRSRTLWKTFD